VSVYQIQFRLVGTRPLMFDRYAGDNNTSLPVEQKMYLNADGGLVLPAANLYSLISAENTKSVVKLFYPPKTAAALRNAFNSFFRFSAIEYAIEDDKSQIVWRGKWSDKIFVHESVARLNKGIPNPKQRPCLNLPWSVSVDGTFVESQNLGVEGLAALWDKSRRIGVGTFRPQFGQFRIEDWKEEKVED